MSQPLTAPYTEAERERDSQDRRDAQAIVSTRRAACPSGQNYYRKPTKADLRVSRRILGENDETSS